MGNVLDVSSPSEDPSNLEILDQMYLDLSNSAIFNESYVKQVFSKLPAYEGTEIEKDSSETKEDPVIDARTHRLMDLYLGRSAKGKNSSAVEEIEITGVSKFSDQSPHALANKMRARLLMRIHQAYLRRTKIENQASKNESSGSAANGSFLKIAPSDSSEGKPTKKEDAGTILSAMTASMCLSIASTVGKDNPTLFLTLSEMLVSMLKSSGSLALASTNTESPLLLHTVSSIVDFAKSVAASASGGTFSLL